mmetsp:Transcript_23927/g.18258  ORF Transcript_23927/g.18258 Transcript_23927/m.18258 type:complete len:261 (+) Transcript_23927:3-785(+)
MREGRHGQRNQLSSQESLRTTTTGSSDPSTRVGAATLDSEMDAIMGLMSSEASREPNPSVSVAQTVQGQPRAASPAQTSMSNPPSQNLSGVSTSTSMIIPLNARSEQLLAPLRFGEAPSIQPSIHATPQSPLCQNCNSALRAVECTNFHCGRCCQRVGALNCLRHNRTQITASGALIIQDISSDRDHDSSDENGLNANQPTNEDEEDIYDLRPDPQLPEFVNTRAQNQTGSTSRPTLSGSGLFEFPQLSSSPPSPSSQSM